MQQWHVLHLVQVLGLLGVIYNLGDVDPEEDGAGMLIC
tara:strand:+ start:2079 stop:2192 length:114 start_codon:yes stop_codon:yes gene_type:complete